MTVIPSAKAVPGGGCTCNPSDSGTPSDRRRYPTFVEVVRTDCGVPATTSVTSLCHASDSAVPTSSVPVERTAICSARWMRSRLSREGRTTLPPIARGGPLGEAARWKMPGRAEASGRMRAHPTEPSTLTATLRANGRSPLSEALEGVPRVVGGGCDEHLGGCVAHLGERTERQEPVLGRVRLASELLG